MSVDVYVYQQYREEGIQRYEIGPRVALAMKPTKNFILRGAWGIYHQPISLMGVPVEDGVEVVGRAENAAHYVIGAEYTPTESFLVRVEGYYNSYDNLVGTHTRVRTAESDFRGPRVWRCQRS